VALLFFTWGAGVRPTVSDEGPYGPLSFIYIYNYYYFYFFIFFAFFNNIKLTAINYLSKFCILITAKYLEC
jgi:hypothetical protein